MRNGASCYLCDDPVRDGDRIVLYHDEAFWQQGFFYHAACWDEASLPAKQRPDSATLGVAAVLLDCDCATCEEPVRVGDEVICIRQAGAMPRVHHSQCLPAEGA